MDGVLKYRRYGRGQCIELGPADFSRRLARVDPRAEQCLAGIDIAQTGDHRLIEKQELYGGGPASEPGL